MVYCTLSCYRADIIVERLLIHLITLNKLGLWLEAYRLITQPLAQLAGVLMPDYKIYDVGLGFAKMLRQR